MEQFPEFKLQQKTKNSPESSKFKTEICRNWKSGLCRYGNSCFFAHGEIELRLSGLVPNKIVRCQQFHDSGYCQFGSRCVYRHQDRSPEHEINFRLGDNKPAKFDKKRLPVFQKLAQEPLSARV